MKGMRQQPQASKKEKMRIQEQELKNLSMSSRLTQMMVKQLMDKLTGLDQDVSRMMGLLNDLQYRTLAMIELSPELKAQIDTKADELKLRDYNEASAKEDAVKGYVSADVVGPDSIVVITSTAPDDAGIFRSKFKLSEAGNPELQGALEGLKVGDKVEVKLNGLMHNIEVLAIREEPSPATPMVAEQTLTENTATVGTA